MKNHFWIYFSLSTAVILLFLFWHRPTKYSQNIEGLQRAAQSNVPSKSAINQNAGNIRTPSLPVNQHPSFITNHPSLTEMIKQEVDGRNKPIDFYGLVIDQNSNAVAGVNIKSGVRHWTMMDPTVALDGLGARTITLEATTGADGRFELTGATGDGFGVLLTKDGYDAGPGDRGFGAGSYSYANPVIFKMWKREKPQNLISHDLRRVGVPVDGSEVQFDLLNGTEGQSGDQLIMRIKRDPQVLPPGHSRYDWSAELEIPNGGLVSSDDDFMYSAPESGYEETYKVEMPKDIDDWKSIFDQNFYIELENGKYFGTLTVHLLTFHSPPPIILNLEIVINPNGSRNLQP